MKKLFMNLPLICLLCFSFGCQMDEKVAEKHAVDIEADVEAIRDWVNGNYAAADSGDLEDYLSYWKEDVIWMPPNAPIIKGTSATREILQPYFEQVAILHEITIEEIKVAGDFAFTRFNSQEKYTPRSGEGKPVEANFKAIILLQRMPDGTWLGTHLMWSSNAPPPTSMGNQ